MDEDDIEDLVNKISNIVIDEMINVDNDKDLDEIVKKMIKCRVHSTKNVCNDTQATSSCSSLSDLSEGYKSKIKKIVEGYSRVGVYSTKDVSADESAQSSRMARINDGDVLKRCKNMEHLDHVSSTCTSPMKKVVIDEIVGVKKDATLNACMDKKRKEGTTAISDSAAHLDSKDKVHSTKKARYDPSALKPRARSEKSKYKLRKRLESYAIVGKYSIKDVMVNQDDAMNSPLVKIDDEDVVKRFENFKKFDIVADYSDHLFSGHTPINERQNYWAKTIHEDWRSLEENLPDTIFVRAYESRMDLLRAVIIGAAGTPYHDGLFFFDVHFPTTYPFVPPFVRYHSGGRGINPNLYVGGEVYMSLPATTGVYEELWVPGTSSLLQLLLSIQDRFLISDPIYNEGAFVASRGDASVKHFSILYNENTFITSLKTMTFIMNKPPKNFEDFVVGHFRNRLRDILMACKAYIEGVQVGCGVSGEGNKDCSFMFRYDVTSCIKPIISAFLKIGAHEAQEFLHLSERTRLPASAPTPRIITTGTRSQSMTAGPMCI